MMGYPCVRLAGKFLASYDDQAGCLVVKLPRERVTELVVAGDGDPFAPAGKVFREWVSIPAIDRELWQTLLAEAVDFARQGLVESRGPSRRRVHHVAGATFTYQGNIASFFPKAKRHAPCLVRTR